MKMQRVSDRGGIGSLPSPRLVPQQSLRVSQAQDNSCRELTVDSKV